MEERYRVSLSVLIRQKQIKSQSYDSRIILFSNNHFLFDNNFMFSYPYYGKQVFYKMFIYRGN